MLEQLDHSPQLRRPVLSAEATERLSRFFALHNLHCALATAQASESSGAEQHGEADRYQRRARQHAAGRRAAASALGRLGHLSSEPIPRGPGGEPLWPGGFIGSISHCSPLSVALVARSCGEHQIGVDVESTDRMREIDISTVVCRNSEHQWLMGQTNFQQVLARIFSAKEAVYKALYPALGRYIDFKEVALCWDSGLPGFTANLIQPCRHSPVAYAIGKVFSWFSEGFVFSCSICQPPIKETEHQDLAVQQTCARSVPAQGSCSKGA